MRMSLEHMQQELHTQLLELRTRLLPVELHMRSSLELHTRLLLELQIGTAAHQLLCKERARRTAARQPWSTRGSVWSLSPAASMEAAMAPLPLWLLQALLLLLLLLRVLVLLLLVPVLTSSWPSWTSSWWPLRRHLHSSSTAGLPQGPTARAPSRAQKSQMQCIPKNLPPSNQKGHWRWIPC